jgi:small subunit ribosomal protein S11
MGKKRTINKGGADGEGSAKSAGRVSKKRLEHGVLHINSTYNNTMVLLTDAEGNAYLASSSGALGFKGAKKGTPFAASKVGELLADKALAMGLKELDIIVKGVGAGRESSIRAFAAKGVTINTIKDVTPVPFNGPRPPKPRRV